jgi:hypothetical protein
VLIDDGEMLYRRGGRTVQTGYLVHDRPDEQPDPSKTADSGWANLIIVDDIWTSVGSTNIDDRALRLNDEANINLFDQDFARDQTALFDKDAAASKPYTFTDWQSRSIDQKVSDWLSSLTRSQI